MNTHYDIPEEVAYIFYEAEAMKSLRDNWLKIPGFYRRTVKAAKESQKLWMQFWYRVHQLYPELDGKTLNFLPTQMVIKVAEKSEE